MVSDRWFRLTRSCACESLAARLWLLGDACPGWVAEEAVTVTLDNAASGGADADPFVDDNRPGTDRGGSP